MEITNIYVIPLLSVYDKSKIQDSFQALAVPPESLFQLPLQTYNCANHVPFQFNQLIAFYIFSKG